MVEQKNDKTIYTIKNQSQNKLIKFNIFDIFLKKSNKEILIIMENS